jgi:Ser/Thr protein kinase RdoA (MazF antagonist)
MICHLLCDDVSVADVMYWRMRWEDDEEQENLRIWKEAVAAYFEVYHLSRNSLERLRELRTQD